MQPSLPPSLSADVMGMLLNPCIPVNALVILNSSYALLKELQSKTEKKLVTSAAIAYGFFFLYKRVPMPISTSKTSRSVGEVIT
ncbi:hypothetical protein Tco_1271429 [Tanacetum coccineum]